jgi:hypothetical protein
MITFVAIIKLIKISHTLISYQCYIVKDQFDKSHPVKYFVEL